MWSIIGLRMRAGAAFFLFPLRVGARLALRVLAPVLAATLFLYYLLRPEFALELTRIVFVESGPIEAGFVGTLILLALARTVVPRVAAGSKGWARSLPANGRSLRRLMALATVLAETPFLIVLGGLIGAVAGPNPVRIAVSLAGLLVGAGAAGLVSLPSSAALWTKLIPLAACFLSFTGSATGLGAAAGLLILSAALAGEVPPSPGRLPPRRSLPPALFFQGLSFRAVRGRIFLAYLPAALVLAGARLFLENNDLPAETAFSLSLFGLVLSLNVFIGQTADSLSARRPAWPWLRSLPRSASARVFSDAPLSGLFSPCPFYRAWPCSAAAAREAAFLAGPLVSFALRGAGAMREAGDRPFEPRHRDARRRQLRDAPSPPPRRRPAQPAAAARPCAASATASPRSDPLSPTPSFLRHGRRALLVFLAAAAPAVSGPARAPHDERPPRPRAPPGGPLGPLEYRGGLHVASSDPRFGGISAMRVLPRRGAARRDHGRGLVADRAARARGRRPARPRRGGDGSAAGRGRPAARGQVVAGRRVARRAARRLVPRRLRARAPDHALPCGDGAAGRRPDAALPARRPRPSAAQRRRRDDRRAAGRTAPPAARGGRSGADEPGLDRPAGRVAQGRLCAPNGRCGRPTRRSCRTATCSFSSAATTSTAESRPSGCATFRGGTCGPGPCSAGRCSRS